MNKKSFAENIIQQNDRNIRYSGIDDSECFVLEGLPFRKKGGRLRRLPEKKELFPQSEGIDANANLCSGVCLRFSTDSSDIRIKAKISLNSGNRSSVARSCFDLYCGNPQESFFAGVAELFSGEPDAAEFEFNSCIYHRDNPNRVMHEFQLNFPPDVEIIDFSIGLENGSALARPSKRKNPKPLIIYGSAVEQGYCASRPGISYANILSRRLNREVINMSFAGNACGENFMAKQLSEIPNPGAFILCYDADVSTDILEKTLPEFTDILRSTHKHTPIITISKFQYPDETPADRYDDAGYEERKKRTEIHADNMHRRIKMDDPRIHFIDGRKILNEPECFYDLLHPNDLGMAKIAENLAPRLAVLTE